jgi:murein DD-endopeptidase MepM/ murein hydrolase activator NlpD
MKVAHPTMTILIHRDGDVDSRTFQIPIWLFRAGIGVVGGLFLLMLLGAVVYLPIVGVAAQVPGLRSEIAALREENAQIRRLVATVDSLEAQYSKVRNMLGANAGTRSAIGGGLMRAPAIVVGIPNLSATSVILNRWPLDGSGYITRGQLGAGEKATHAGIDIAVPEGTPVRVAGSGTVLESGRDREYGSFVLVQHQDGFETRYAHLSRTLVGAGLKVPAGEVIGLSGNSGRSSAPHLHFEIRQRGQSIDPRTLLKEGR